MVVVVLLLLELELELELPLVAARLAIGEQRMPLLQLQYLWVVQATVLMSRRTSLRARARPELCAPRLAVTFLQRIQFTMTSATTVMTTTKTKPTMELPTLLWVPPRPAAPPRVARPRRAKQHRKTRAGRG